VESNFTFEELEQKINGREVRIDSLNYLVTWKQKKEEWKFKKSRQVFLLKNIYNLWQIPIKHFKILVNYIKAIPEGTLREEIKKEAIEMIEKPQKIVYDDIELKVEKEMKQKIL